MSIGDKMLKGVIWSGIEKISVQFVSFVVGVVLARLLTPTEYGTVGLLIVFLSISQVFIDSGFTQALIQKQNRTKVDVSTVFYFNLFIALLCYIVLWFSSPYIASFYQTPKLESLLKVLAISLIFNGLYAIPNTLLSIEMNFKTLSKVTFSSTIISGVIAIYLAYKDYGEWALVWQTLIRAILMNIIIWFYLKWKPKLVFSIDSFRTLFSFGSKLLVSSLLMNLNSNFSSLFIAKIINTKQLGFFTRGTQFADTFFNVINTVLNNVLLPGLAPLQDNLKKLIEMTKKVIVHSSLLITPIFIGLAALSKPLIIILLGEKWLMAVPIMQILCLARLITAISGINVNLLYVIGRSDLVLKQQYLKIAIRVVLLAISLPFGIVIIALAELLSTIVHFFINSYYPGKIMQYGATKQIKDLRSTFMISLFMGAVVYFFSYQISNPYWSISLSLLFAVPFYLLMIKKFQRNDFEELYSKLKGIMSKK